MVHAACANCGPKSQHRATRIALAPTPYSMLPWRPPAHLVPTGDSGPQLAQAIAEEDLSQDLMDLVPTVTGAPFSIDDGPLCGPDQENEEILPTELNEKQYARVILRRDFKAESLRRGMGAVKQVSRQEHALRRPRGPQGRFLRSGEEPAKPPLPTLPALRAEAEAMRELAKPRAQEEIPSFDASWAIWCARKIVYTVQILFLSWVTHLIEVEI